MARKPKRNTDETSTTGTTVANRLQGIGDAERRIKAIRNRLNNFKRKREWLSTDIRDVLLDIAKHVDVEF